MPTREPTPRDLYAAATGQTGAEYEDPPQRESQSDVAMCECGDYHTGDDDHHGVSESCPRPAERDGLCLLCWYAYPS